MKISHITLFLAGVISCVFVGLAVNSYNQAKICRKIVVSKFQVAVFLAPNSINEVVGEHLQNMDGVSKVELITSDKIYEKVIKDTPSAKEILLGAENPFTPYFLMTIDKIDPQFIGNMKLEVLKVIGVEDVRYDENIPIVVSKLDSFIGSFKAIFKIIFVLTVIIILARFCYQFFADGIDYVRYLFDIVVALASGVAGSWFYYSLSTVLAPSENLILPSHYLTYLIFVPLLAVLLWERT